MTSTPAKNKRALFFLKPFNFLAFGLTALLTPFLPLYLQHQGFNSIEIGLLLAIGPFTSLFANPFWGYLSDRWQNTRLVLIAMLCGNLLMSFFVFGLHNFYALYAAMIGFFFCYTALFSMTSSLILHGIEGTPYQFGSFRLWGSIGFAVTALVAGPLMKGLGISSLGIIYGVMLVANLALSFYLPRQGSQADNASLRELGKVFANRYFVVFLLLSVLVSIPNQMNYIFLPLHMTAIGGSEAAVGTSFFLAAIGEVIVFVLLDRYLPPTPKAMTGLLALTSSLFSLRWFLMSVATDPVQLIAIQFLHCVTFGTYFYIGTQLCAKLVPSNFRASGQALFAMTWAGFSGIVAGSLGGWLYDAYSALGIYGVGSVMAAAAAVCFGTMWWRLSTAPTSYNELL
ncbi:MFS transporter [Numidum massiliense]|uniref:MFS transporter n=1 Tax=Numidum massiliense TaxID=1522315 RepID=UPI0006D5593A|nr:MFS transporter [Numidum massiliense]